MNIKDIIQELAKAPSVEIYSKIAKVTKVDGYRVDVDPVDGSAPILEALLTTQEATAGIVAIPKEGSLVVVTFTSNSGAWVSLVNDPERIEITSPEIVFNGGDNKGLIIAQALKTEIDKLNSNFEKIKNVIANAPVTPNDGGASFKAALVSGLTFAKAEIDKTTNDKITH
jgi:hypothetical protein